MLPVEGVVVVHDTCLWIEFCDGRLGEGDKGVVYFRDEMDDLLEPDGHERNQRRDRSSTMKRPSMLKSMFDKSVLNSPYAKR